MLNKLNRKDIINYSIAFAIFLVFLSSFDHSFNIKVLISFFLMSIIVYWLTNDIYKSVILSFIITFIYYTTNNNSYENFENQDLKVDDIVKELTNISETIKKDDEKDDEKDEKNDENLSKNDITEDDLELFDDDDKTPTENNQYIESAKAQRETHRLINTIKQLQDTVEHLAPTLKQGATIIDKFKKLNLISDQ